MSDQAPDSGDVAAQAAGADHSGLLRQLGPLLGALRAAPVGSTILRLVIELVVVIAATAYGQIRLNSWNKPFFDALSRRDTQGFLLQLGVFFLIICLLLLLNVAQRWLVETLKVVMREGLVQHLVGLWLSPRRAYWLGQGGSMGVNPDQRMHEDARKLCELSADLGSGLLQASVLFSTFAGILWVLSRDFSFRIGGEDHPIPGFMLWVAVLYAGGGSLLSYWVGSSLIGRNAERYAREADLRSSLVHVNEHLDGISLAAGEAGERRRIELDLAAALAATRRIVSGLTNLTWITAGFGWITLVAPILVAVPLYFNGKISFGGLMMAAAAFTQAQSSLRWFVDNFSTIADWRATLLRVASFRQALSVDALPDGVASRIRYDAGEPGVLLLEGLEIESPAGHDKLEESSVRLRAGERVLIADAPGTGKTALFRALAGLWPWGAGRLAIPPHETLQYLAHGTPYLPRGTLREVLSYPAPSSRYSEEDCGRALRRLGLERLLPQLEQTQRWERELSQEQQLSLAFARIALQAPSWVVVDDIFGALDAATLQRVLELFGSELKDSGLIHIGRLVPGAEALFGRVLHLVKARPQPGAVAGGENA
jgi:putative ATP-binding cassette transporter